MIELLALEVLENLTVACYIVDRDWRFAYINPCAERFWNRPRKQLLGRNIWEEFPEAVGSVPYQEHQRVLQEQLPIQFKTVSPVLNRLIEVNIFPVSSGLAVRFRESKD